MKTENKPIEYYTYSCKCVSIYWNGIYQRDCGIFKSAIDAKKHIKKTYEWQGNDGLKLFRIRTPDTQEDIKPFN